MQNLKFQLQKTEPANSKDFLSAPAFLLQYCYSQARLNNGMFSTASAEMKELIEMGVASIEADEKSKSMTLDLREEPIMYESLRNVLGDDPDVDNDPILRLMASRLALEGDFSRMTATKGYLAEDALAWILMRHCGQPLMTLRGMQCTTFPSWLQSLHLSHSTAWRILKTPGSELFHILNLSAASNSSMHTLPNAAECIFLPDKQMGPDLILYFPASSARAFPVLLCIQCKAKFETDATLALFSINPGMFYCRSRDLFKSSPLSIATRMDDWSRHVEHRDVRFVRMLFSLRPIPSRMIEAVNTYNGKLGEHGSMFPILLCTSTPETCSTAVHKSLTMLCTPDIDRSKSTSPPAWSFPTSVTGVAVALQYAYPFQPEARKWQYKKKNATDLTQVSDDETVQRGNHEDKEEEKMSRSEEGEALVVQKRTKRKKRTVRLTEGTARKQVKLEKRVACAKSCPMSCPGVASSTNSVCDRSCELHCPKYK